MIRIQTLIAIILVSFTSMAFASLDSGPQERVRIKVGKAYIPQGYDNNDVAKIVVEGTFPNTCYKLGKNAVRVDEKNNVIKVLQTAYVYKEMCLMMLVPFSETVEVGVLKKTGKYMVKDAASAKPLGALPVTESRNNGPDDHMYANVHEAYVTKVEPNRQVVVLRGHLPGNCWMLTDKKVVLEGKDVLTVLPIMDYNADDNCSRQPIPFTTTVDIPNMPRGRYLLNVRSLSGKSINTLFNAN